MSKLKTRQPLPQVTEPRRAPPQRISVDEAHAQFRGQWVILRVTNTDRFDVPTHGEIVAYSPSDAAICRKLSKLVPPTEPSTSRYYLFWAHPRTSSAEELVRAFEQVEERGAAGAWRRD